MSGSAGSRLDGALELAHRAWAILAEPVVRPAERVHVARPNWAPAHWPAAGASTPRPGVRPGPPRRSPGSSTPPDRPASALSALAAGRPRRGPTSPSRSKRRPAQIVQPPVRRRGLARPATISLSSVCTASAIAVVVAVQVRQHEQGVRVVGPACSRPAPVAVAQGLGPLLVIVLQVERQPALGGRRIRASWAPRRGRRRPGRLAVSCCPSKANRRPAPTPSPEVRDRAPAPSRR